MSCRIKDLGRGNPNLDAKMRVARRPLTYRREVARVRTSLDSLSDIKEADLQVHEVIATLWTGRLASEWLHKASSEWSTTVNTDCIGISKLQSLGN